MPSGRVPLLRSGKPPLTGALVAFQTVFGELLALEDNSDVTGMAVFVLHRLLWNPDIAAAYRHPSVPHLYRDGERLRPSPRGALAASPSPVSVRPCLPETPTCRGPPPAGVPSFPPPPQ